MEKGTKNNAGSISFFNNKDKLSDFMSKNHHLFSQPPLDCLREEEKLALFREAFKLRVGGSSARYEKLCSFESHSALIPVIADILTCEVKTALLLIDQYTKVRSDSSTALSDQYKARLDQSKARAHNSAEFCTRAIKSANISWRSLKKKEAIEVARKKSVLLETLITSIYISMGKAGLVTFEFSQESKDAPSKDEEHGG